MYIIRALAFDVGRVGVAVDACTGVLTGRRRRRRPIVRNYTRHQHVLLRLFNTRLTASSRTTWVSRYQKGGTTHTHPFNGPFSGLPRSAGTKKVKPIWILLKQETVSGSGINSAICKSAPCSRQITTPLTPATHHSVFYRLDALPAAQPTASKH